MISYYQLLINYKKIDFQFIYILNIFIMFDNKINIALVGNVDSGKSTLVGILKTRTLDNGRGSARINSTNLKHELESGRTSNVNSSSIRIYDGEIVGNINTKMKETSKIMTLVDLCGHEKYFKTTLYGMTGTSIDYALLVVGANMGVTKMTREHLGILMYMELPIVVVITKRDLSPEHIYKRTLDRIKKMLKIKRFNRIPINCNKNTDITDVIQLFKENKLVTPIFTVSNVEGLNLNQLYKFIYNFDVPVYKQISTHNGSLIYVDCTFQVKGIGIVICGTLYGDTILAKSNKEYYIGPDNGKFIPFKIRSIHNNFRESIDEIHHGEYGCFAIRFVKNQLEKNQIKKGMVVTSGEENFRNNVKWSFKANITILNHSTTIKNNYQPVIHCGSVRQTAIVNILESDGELRTGCTALIEFKFKFHPEYIESNKILFFRDGNTKGFGTTL